MKQRFATGEKYLKAVKVDTQETTVKAYQASKDATHSRNYERGKSDNTSVENTRIFTTEFLRIPYGQHSSIPGDSTSEDVVTISGSQRYCQGSANSL